MSFAVCSAVDCQPETEKVLNATIAVSNNHFAVSKNMNRGSVRGLVLKSPPTQPKDSTDEEMAWNDSVIRDCAFRIGSGPCPRPRLSSSPAPGLRLRLVDDVPALVSLDLLSSCEHSSRCC